MASFTIDGEPLDPIQVPSQTSSDSGSPVVTVGSTPTSDTTPSAANRSLAPRRSRKGFASQKSRLSLSIDADATASADGASIAGQSTPVSTSSSCSSDVVPWWELEYKCPPPGHLGAHVVPVSVDQQPDHARREEGVGLSPPNAMPPCSITVAAASIEAAVDQSGSPNQQPQIVRPALVLHETPERAHRRPRSNLPGVLSSVPCLLVDSSPNQKRKIRHLYDRDPSELFSTNAAKELKRFHDYSSKEAEMEPQDRQKVVTPSTLVRPLTEIDISQALRPAEETTRAAAE